MMRQALIGLALGGLLVSGCGEAKKETKTTKTETKEPASGKTETKTETKTTEKK